MPIQLLVPCLASAISVIVALHWRSRRNEDERRRRFLKRVRLALNVPESQG